MPTKYKRPASFGNPRATRARLQPPPTKTVTRRDVRNIAQKVLNKNAEWKYHLVFNNSGVSTSGAIIDLSAVSQGDTDTTRDGDSITASTLGYRYFWQNGDDTNACRLIFFQWYPQTTPTVTDILLTTVGNGVQFMYHTDKADMYKILYDSTDTLSVYTASGGSVLGSPNIGKIKIPKRKIQFQAGTTTGSNKIYALVLSDSGATSHPGPNLMTRLNYMD